MSNMHAFGSVAGSMGLSMYFARRAGVFAMAHRLRFHVQKHAGHHSSPGMPLHSHWSVVFGAGAGIGVALALVYERYLKTKVGAYANPSWGRTKVRSAFEKVVEQAKAAPPVLQAEPSTSVPEPIKEQLKRSLGSMGPGAAPVPPSFLKKHPKGVGVDLVKVEGMAVDEVLMLPVPNLGKFYESTASDNSLGTGIHHQYNQFTNKEDLILGDIVRKEGMPPWSRGYLRAGPRKTLYFNPKEVNAAIVTCGGLCPGLNNIVREVTKSLINLYGAKKVYGIRGGYWGFHEGGDEPMVLDHDAVRGIQHLGGTVLGSARGGYDLEQILGFCKRKDISQLYIVGGDGTHRAANKVGLEALARRLNLAVAGIPKTIDNDLDLVDRTFGFNSAVMAAQDAIRSASVEARCNLPNGIGIVKLMGRHAGFIAAHATLASGEVDLCLVPEVPIELEGTYGILPHIERVLKTKGKAVIVVAEGAGEELVGAEGGVDAGGNKKLPEIGPFIKDTINKHFKSKGTTVNVKYIDPSYMIRSVPANASDALFCMLLAQNAVHGAVRAARPLPLLTTLAHPLRAQLPARACWPRAQMAGYTCFTTGLCCNRTVYLPIPALVENSPRKMDQAGRTWERIITVTGQPNRPCDKSARPDSAVQPATIF